MKRLHVNLSVTDLDQSVAFYSALFAAEPTVLKPDYAKWMLDDPRVNFAISTRQGRGGVDHLGIQAEDAAEFEEIRGRLAGAGARTVRQDATTCCYARSDKTWVYDPDGAAWETFHTFGESPVFGEDLAPEAPRAAGPCCSGQPDAAVAAPAAAGAKGCCK